MKPGRLKWSRWVPRAAVAAALMLFIAGPQAVVAHPLGASSNVYTRLELEGSGVRLRYVLDVSEQIAVGERRFIDLNSDGTIDDAETKAYLDGLWLYLEPKLTLTIAGTRVAFIPGARALTFPPGQGGLPLLRVEIDAHGTVTPAPGPRDGQFVESSFEELPGWHEVIVKANAEATILESSVPAQDLTNELRTYPTDRLNNPLRTQTATFRYVTAAPSSSGGASPVPVPSVAGTAVAASPSNSPPSQITPPPIPPAASGGLLGLPTIPPAQSTAAPGGGRPSDPLVGLADGPLSPLTATLALFIALGLGALHAVSPGHGKTVVAAYLIGTRASVRQAIWLGLTVAITHTIGVLFLGLLTYVATEWIIPTRIVSWLSVATGALVILLGAALAWQAWRGHAHRQQPHEHPHPHRAPGKKHRHDKSGQLVHEEHAVSTGASLPSLRRRDIALLGIVGGLVPSGSALLLLLSSIALGRVAFGILLLLLFGAGMALVLVAIATGVVLLRRSSIAASPRWRHPHLAKLIVVAPLLSGIVVAGFGVVLTVQALAAVR